MNIGFGVILPGSAFNTVRDLEVKLMTGCKSEAGLSQDPHVTIKRPFAIEKKSLPVFLGYLKNLSNKVKPFEISLQGIGFFGTSTIFLTVRPSKKLRDLHQMIASDLHTLGIKDDKYDGANMVFHTTLAMNLSESQYKKAMKIISTIPEIKLTFVFDEIGIFLNIEEYDSWVVLVKQKIG
jgi:2'-5' RNA ligase